jgi:hypothetical protein
MNEYSQFLFARPSFIKGMGQVLDIGSTMNAYNRSRTPEEADRIALAADWKAIGCDIAAAIAQVRDEQEKEK